jgi:hypothetical protein
MLSIWRYRGESAATDGMHIQIEDVSVDHHANPLLTMEEELNARLDREL